MENRLPKRKTTRLKSYDYSRTGVYFVTICIHERKRILSDIVKLNDNAVNKRNAQAIVGEGLAPPENEKFDLSVNSIGYTSFANNYKVELTEIGEIVKDQLFALEERYKNVTIKDYVIMPDHIDYL